jgi:hypothetical protein
MGEPKGLAMAPQTFGNRFLAEFRRLGGSTNNWPERALTVLNEADRRQFIDALRKASPRTAAQLVITAHTAEPEKLAKRAVELTKPKPADSGPTWGFE